MRTPGQRGFTLIETIAAVVVIAVAVPPMLWSMRDAQIQRVNPILASRARWLATEKLEDVIADRHSSTRGYDYLIAANYASESPVPGFANFDRTVTLAETAADLASAGTGYMTITIEVSWDDAVGDPQSLSVASVVTEFSP